MTWVLDLDGVVWLADTPVPGAANAVAELRGAGRRVVFITNNSAPTISDLVSKLQAFGIPATEPDVLTSAQAAAMMLDPGSTALVCAGVGVEEALQRRGVRIVRTGRADAVVVGFHRDFDFDRLTAAFRAVQSGARLIGTNDDATYPTATGPLPGGGSLLAAVAYASGAKAEVAGKPFDPMATLIREKVGPVETVVGDRPSTDGRLAVRLGARFALVLTGVTSERDLPVNPSPDVVGADLAAVLAQV
jgi:4-nitrophenyl phosphatase